MRVNAGFMLDDQEMIKMETRKDHGPKKKKTVNRQDTLMAEHMHHVVHVWARDRNTGSSVANGGKYACFEKQILVIGCIWRKTGNNYSTRDPSAADSCSPVIQLQLSYRFLFFWTFFFRQQHLLGLDLPNIFLQAGLHHVSPTWENKTLPAFCSKTLSLAETTRVLVWLTQIHPLMQSY